jgi:putative phage-type endonuclease
MDIRFSPYKIATMTIIANIFYEINKSTKINLTKLYKELNIDENIVYICHTFNKNINTKGVSTKKKKKKNFSNSMKIEFLINGNILSVKFCQNGTIHITGVKSRDSVDLFIEIIKDIFDGLSSDIFSHELNIHFSRYAMVKCNTGIIYPENIYLDSKKIHTKIKEMNDPTIISVYENSEHKHFSIKKKIENFSVSYEIFNSGKLNFSGKINPENEIEKSFNFIKRFISENFDDFIIKDCVFNTIKALECNNNKQRSRKWFKRREKYITASEICAALGKSKYLTQDEWLRRKAENIRFNSNNKFITKGIILEPIAGQLYIHMHNKKFDHKIHLFETGFHTRGIIGASPDGVIFKFDTNVTFSNGDYIPIETLKKLYKMGEKRDNKIKEVFLLEIKCLSNPKIIKNVRKELKEYYYQIQTQMYVMNIPFAVLMINNFEMTYSEIEFLLSLKKNKRTPFYGVFLKKGNLYKYPKMIYNDLSKCKEDINDKLLQNDKYIYWKLNSYQIINIYYDEEFIKKKMDKIEKIHNKLLKKIKYPTFGPEEEKDWL